MEIGIEEIIREYSQGVYTLAFRLCRNKQDADDLYQSAFLSITQKGSLDKAMNIKSYLYTTVLNIYRKKYAKRKREMISYIDETALSSIPSDSPDPEDEYITGQRYKCIRQAICEMEDKYRIPVLLHYELGFTMEEISKSIRAPSGTVKTRLKRAREIIKKRLEAEQWITWTK